LYRLSAGAERLTAAVLLSIDHPSREVFTYNVDQASARTGLCAKQEPDPRPVL